MSKAKIAYALQMIEDIEVIVKRHGSITKALSDIEGQHAIMMCLFQIGESLNKIDPSVCDTYALQEDVKGAYLTRNVIAHNYEGVRLDIIEEILRIHLPPLKSKLKKALNA